MTGTEAALAARKYANAYKYIYGAKGELCSSAHIEDLIAQSPAYFSDAQKRLQLVQRQVLIVQIVLVLCAFVQDILSMDLTHYLILLRKNIHW